MQNVITGVVVTADTGASIPYAKVYACFRECRNYRETVADGEGRFAFTQADKLERGMHTVEAVASGWTVGSVKVLVHRDPINIQIPLCVLPEVQDNEWADDPKVAP